MIGNARELARDILCSLFRTKEELSPSEWAARFRIVTLTDTPGPWSNEVCPYLVEIMDAFADPTVRLMTVIKGSQTGGTECLYNMLFWAIDQRPGLTMFIYPDADSAADQNQVRFTPTLEATPKINAHMSGRKYDAKAKSIKFDTMQILFRGSFSEHKLETFPAPYVVVDELDRCPPRTAHLAQQRGKTYASAKTVFNGKPGLAGQGIDLQYSLSDQRQFHVPCPHCLIYHVRTFAMVRWHGHDRNGQWTEASRDVQVEPAEAERTAWLQCPNCGGRCGPEHHRAQLRAGRWAPKGQSVTDARRLDGELVAGSVVGPKPTTNHRGWKISGLISGLKSNPYGEAARGFVERRGRIDPDFLADVLAEAYQPVGDRVEVSHIREGIATVDAGGYRMGQIPNGVLALMAGVDIQESGHAFVEVRGFGEQGKDRWLVWHERVPAPINLGLGSLDELLFRRKWIRLDGKPLKIFARFIDSGDRTTEVYDYCRTRSVFGHIFAVKGVGDDARGKMDQPYLWRRIDRYPGTGKPMPSGVRLLRLDSSTWKSETLRRLRVKRSAEEDEREAAAELVTGGEARTDIGEWRFPVDVSDDYLRQLTAEHCVAIRKGSTTTWRWSIRPGRTDNHYFDCATYLEAGAEALAIRMLRAPAGVAASTDLPAPEEAEDTPDVEISETMQRARKQGLRHRK